MSSFCRGYVFQLSRLSTRPRRRLRGMGVASREQHSTMRCKREQRSRQGLELVAELSKQAGGWEWPVSQVRGLHAALTELPPADLARQLFQGQETVP